MEYRDTYSIDHHRTWPRFVLAALCLAIAASLAGCSGGAAAASQPPTVVTAVAIESQPTDASIPMGLSATFSVSASGSSPQYQWTSNGAAIAGANTSSYTIPSTSFADSGTSYAVTVSSSAGSVDSNTVTLTVTARAPQPGDLRFQQVDAATTVNGYGSYGGLSTDLLNNSSIDFFPSIGAPFAFGSGPSCLASMGTETGACSWLFTQYSLGSSAGAMGLTMAYATGRYTNFASDMQTALFPNNTSPDSSGSVVTSLDLEPLNSAYALSWIQSNSQSGFDYSIETASAAGLQAAISLDGANDRVVTGISYDNGQVAFISYGWSADASGPYDVEVIRSTTNGALSAAASLASQGYIITASGRADDNGDVHFVGTRVEGDSMPRPSITQPLGAAALSLLQQGYATVGVVYNASQINYMTYLGER